MRFRSLVVLAAAIVAAGGLATPSGWSDARAAGTNCDARGIAVQRDGKILVATHARPGFGTTIALTRLTSRGRADTRFASASRAVLDVGADVNDARVAVDSRGRIVVYARRAAGAAYTLFRLTRRGLLDETFGDRGRVEGSFPVAVADFAVDRNDRIVVVGTATGQSSTDIATRRYLATGALDLAFGTVLVNLAGDDFGQAVTIDRERRIVIAASSGSPNDVAVVRLTEGGAPDLTFGANGASISPVDGNEPVFDVAVSRRGEPVVAAYSSASGQAWLATKFDQFGRLTSGFGAGGVSEIAGSTSGDPDAIVVDSRSRVLVSGYIAGAAAVARLSESGALDPRFGEGGIVRFPVRPADATYIETWYAISRARRGRLVLAGTREESGGRVPMVAQLRSDGRPDVNFGVGGLVNTGL